jgi:hypothetical protein
MTPEPGRYAEPDPFVHDDAAYVLGALPAADRAAFDEHLAGCAACADRVRELSELPGLLSAVHESDLQGEAMPDTLLPGLLRRAAVERRRRRTISSALAGLAAACLIALVVAVWPAQTAGPKPAPPQAMAAVVASPVRATAALVSRSWGTQIDLTCTYDDGTTAAGYAYGLTVTATDGNRYQLGTWRLQAGRAVTFASGVALPRDQIASVEITTGTQPILRLTV